MNMSLYTCLNCEECYVREFMNNLPKYCNKCKVTLSKFAKWRGFISDGVLVVWNEETKQLICSICRRRRVTNHVILCDQCYNQYSLPLGYLFITEEKHETI